MSNSTSSGSGADLARQALAAALAAAKTRPATGPQKPRRTTRPTRGSGRDPQGLGSVLECLTAEQGWTDSIGGGNLIDQWATIAPTELASTVQPVAYDAERGILEVRPSSPAYATQVRLFQQQLAKHLNTQLGRHAVRGIRVLAPGHTTTATDPVPEPARPAADAPVKTREDASPGYRATLEAAIAHRPARQPADPYVLEAIVRQEAALRANRQPEHEHREAVWAHDQAAQKTGPAPGSMEASEAAARSYARRQAADRTIPRALDAA